MTQGTSSDPWLSTLKEGARLLEAGEAEHAAQVLLGLQALCELSAPQPRPEVAAQARELLQRCLAAGSRLRLRVVEDLNRFATGQRAQVYRGQGPR
jgi:hypothetical protein